MSTRREPRFLVFTVLVEEEAPAGAQLYIMMCCSFLSAVTQFRRYSPYWLISGGVLPELDGLKEKIAYLKLLQGIAVVTFISLLGWLVTSAERATELTVALAIVGVVLLGMAIIAVHRQIENVIDEIRRL